MSGSTDVTPAADRPGLPPVTSVVKLSVVIPAYNEITRLPRFLSTARPYLDSLAMAYEVLVVDDGSQDGTGEYCRRLSVEWPAVETHIFEKNRGKGAAVRFGMLQARGEFVLFCDADGAAPIAEEARLRRYLAEGWDAAIGSRYGKNASLVESGTQAVCRRSWHRRLAGRWFAGVARLFLGLPYSDTQCGFKMFRRAAAQRIFSLCDEERFLLDLEALLIARRLGFRIKEVPIAWTEQDGSKMSIQRDAPRMLLGLARLRKLS